MSASREKKARRERGADYVSPKQQKALEEQKAARRTTVIFAVCAAAFAVAVAAMLLWNSGIFQRGAAAVSVDGKSYSAADASYYYYNGYMTLANAGSVSTTSSLRDQPYTGTAEGYETWYDYLSDQASTSLASAELAAQAANAAGFDGGGDVEATVSETMASLEASAASYGYNTSDYIKAVFGSLMNRSVLERNLRTVALAEAYAAAKSDVAAYSDAELDAAYDADPNAYSTVDYEYAAFTYTNYRNEETGDDGTAATRAAAEDALARYRAGESLEAVAGDMDASYVHTTAYYGDSEVLEWLFDDARRDGDAAVLDYAYYGVEVGYMTVVFHAKERADYHAVDVRHILVEDEATANDVLAQYNAGAQTEDAFAALAREYSTDNADDGGLYTGVYRGQMVAPFENWCFDAARRPGDTGVVQTDYGYHVMYFVGAHAAAYWQEQAAAKLADDWMASLVENADIRLLDGMKYIDP